MDKTITEKETKMSLEESLDRLTSAIMLLNKNITAHNTNTNAPCVAEVVQVAQDAAHPQPETLAQRKRGRKPQQQIQAAQDEAAPDPAMEEETPAGETPAGNDDMIENAANDGVTIEQLREVLIDLKDNDLPGFKQLCGMYNVNNLAALKPELYDDMYRKAVSMLRAKAVKEDEFSLD